MYFLVRFIIGMFVFSAALGLVTGFLAGLTGTDLRLTRLGSLYTLIVALPVTFWAFYATLNGKYDRFNIILSEKAISGDRCDE